MKICVSSTGKLESVQADFRFGRCPYFAIYDTEKDRYSFLENAGVTSSQGAGIAAAQQVIDEKVDAVITGNMGPNAMKLLNAANIKIYEIKSESVKEAIALFKEEKLNSIDAPAPSHFGMQNRKGW